jgi:hypothetical protein
MQNYPVPSRITLNVFKLTVLLLRSLGRLFQHLAFRHGIVVIPLRFKVKSLFCNTANKMFSDSLANVRHKLMGSLQSLC